MKSAIDLNRVFVFLISTALLVSFSACGGSSLDKKLAEAQSALAPILDKADRGRQERLELARFFVRHGSVERAEAELRQGLEATPGDVQLRIQLADLFLQQKQFATALATLDEGLGIKADLLLSDSQALSNAKARVLLVFGKASEALVVVESLLAEDSKQAGPLAIKGQILIKQGRGHAAASIFRDILQRQPRDLNGYLHLAEAYAASGDVDLSIKALRDGLRLAPQSALLRKALAKAHTARKDYKAAEVQLQQVLATPPISPPRWSWVTSTWPSRTTAGPSGSTTRCA